MIELIAAFALGVAVCLGALWPHLRSLKSTIRLYRTYVHKRLDDQTVAMGINGKSLDPRLLATPDRGMSEVDNQSIAAAPGESKMETRPQLIVTGSGKCEAIHYVCSECRQILPLPEDESPKNAPATLIKAFKEHVSRNHPEAEPR